MNEIQNNQENLEQNFKTAPNALETFLRLIQFLSTLILLFAVIALFFKLLFNINEFYQVELVAWNTLMAGFADPQSATLTPIILAAWPIVVCVISFLVIIGNTVIFIKYDPINWLKRKVAALEALCPDWFGSSPLPWGAWLNCRMELNTYRAALWSLIGVTAVAAVIVFINVIVITA